MKEQNMIIEALKGHRFTKEQMRESLHRELQAVAQTCVEIVNTPEAVDALAEAYWKRYQEIMSKTETKPE